MSFPLVGTKASESTHDYGRGKSFAFAQICTPGFLSFLIFLPGFVLRFALGAEGFFAFFFGGIADYPTQPHTPGFSLFLMDLFFLRLV